MQPAATSDQALGNVQSFTQNMQSPDQFYGAAQQSLGVPQQQQQVSALRQAVTNTTNLLNNVTPSVEGRTANSLVTSGQANRQIANESAPIAKDLKQQSSDYSNASNDLKYLLTQAGDIAKMREQGQTAQLDALNKVYGDLSSKEKLQFDQAMQQQDLSLKQQSAGIQQQSLDERVRADRANEALAQTKAQTLSPSEQKSLYDLQQQQQIVNGYQSMTSQLKTVAGSDGYVSPQDYGKAKQAWTSAGLDPGKFDTYFSGFRNPTNKYYPVDKSVVSSLTNAGY